MPDVTENVRKSVQDAAYIAVGVGVLGAQQAQERAEAGVIDARRRVESLLDEVRERVEPVVAKVEERIEPVLGDLEARVEPIVHQVRVKLAEVATTGTAKAKAFLGRDGLAPKATAPAA